MFQKFQAHGFKAVHFVLIMTPVRHERYQKIFVDDIETIIQDGGVSVIKEPINGHPTLRIGNNQAYIVDECGRLSFIIVPPWSLVEFSYIKAGVLSTLFDVPCGDCDVPFIAKPYPSYGSELEEHYEQLIIKLENVSKNETKSETFQILFEESNGSEELKDEVSPTTETSTEFEENYPTSTSSEDVFSTNLIVSDQDDSEYNTIESTETITTEENFSTSDFETSSTNPFSTTEIVQPCSTDGSAENQEEPDIVESMAWDLTDLYQTTLRTVEKYPDFISDDDLNDPDIFKKYQSYSLDEYSDALNDSDIIPLRIIIPVEHVHHNALINSYKKYNYIVLNSHNNNNNANNSHSHLDSDDGDEFRKVKKGSPEFIKAERLLTDSNSTELYVNQMGQIYAKSKQYQNQVNDDNDNDVGGGGVGNGLNEVTLLETDIIRDPPKITRLREKDLTRHYNLLIQWLNWQFEDIPDDVGTKKLA